MKIESCLRISMCLLLAVAVAVGCGSPKPEPETEPVIESEKPAKMPTTSEQLADIKTDLETTKNQLAAEGKYDCCIHPACSWCALHEGECKCHDNIKAGKEVCPGCGLGWHNGQGVVTGVSADDVKWNITHEHPSEAGHRH